MNAACKQSAVLLETRDKKAQGGLYALFKIENWNGSAASLGHVDITSREKSETVISQLRLQFRSLSSRFLDATEHQQRKGKGH
jgi:hypothetical protein